MGGEEPEEEECPECEKKFPDLRTLSHTSIKVKRAWNPAKKSAWESA